LNAGILPVRPQRGKGIIVVKGISTSKEQISVTRIADHAVRGVKNVSDNFIGTLNSPSGRLALKEKLREFLEFKFKDFDSQKLNKQLSGMDTKLDMILLAVGSDAITDLLGDIPDRSRKDKKKTTKKVVKKKTVKKKTAKKQIKKK